MTEEPETDALLRDFLLGKLDEEQRDRIEELFLLDEQEKERVMIAEDELIEDYFEDSLTAEDKERFLAIYAQTAEQRQKLKFTKALKGYATQHAAIEKAKTESPLDAKLFSPLFAMSAVAVVVIAVVAVMIMINSGSSTAAIEAELAGLNSPQSLREVPPQLESLELQPGIVRSGERGVEFRPSATTKIVELRLVWNEKNVYSNYQVTVGRVGSKSMFRLPQLQSEERTLRLRLPSHFLTRGQYLITVVGLPSDATPSTSAEYTFTVLN